jgi:hypothetical protein
VGPTGPRAVCGLGVLLGPVHEEKGIIRRAVHSGRGRRIQGSAAATHRSGQQGGGGSNKMEGGGLLQLCSMRQNGPVQGC